MSKRFYPSYTKRADYKTNAKSYYDYLAKVNEYLKMMAERIECQDEKLAQSIKDMQEKINSELERIVEGDYLVEQYIDSLEQWIDRNLTDIVARISKIVWFGLNDGYFIAVIPDSWNTITFDSTDDGHLVLKY